VKNTSNPDLRLASNNPNFVPTSGTGATPPVSFTKPFTYKLEQNQLSFDEMYRLIKDVYVDLSQPQQTKQPQNQKLYSSFYYF
jgi:hypothetical protein